MSKAEELARRVVDEWFPTERGKEDLIRRITSAFAPHLNASPSPVEVVEKMRDECYGEYSKYSNQGATETWNGRIAAFNQVIAELKKESQ